VPKVGECRYFDEAKKRRNTGIMSWKLASLNLETSSVRRRRRKPLTDGGMPAAEICLA
jgi:hypothetical protein